MSSVVRANYGRKDMMKLQVRLYPKTSHRPYTFIEMGVSDQPLNYPTDITK